jgi:cellobiose epimerase
MSKKLIASLFLFVMLFSCKEPIKEKESFNATIANELENSLRQNLLETWYPKAVDWDSGGYYSNFTHDFQLKEGRQDKMIVTQSRHLWSNSKATVKYPDVAHYREAAQHGFKFLRDKMWDKENGGFFQMVDRSGNPLLEREGLKTAYGNSFGIYSLAAYFGATGDSAGLELAVKSFSLARRTQS